MGGLGTRGKATVTIKDFPWGDLDTDPYVSDRTYNPMSQGTYWGKFKGRNPYYRGAKAIIWTGFVDPSAGQVFDFSNFKPRYYIIDKIEGPSGGKRARVSIHLQDVLIKAFGEQSVYPSPNTETLSADLNETATSFSVGSGEGAAYGTSGYIAIGTEVMSFTRSGDTFSVTRAQFNTDAEEHDAGEVVQECLYYDDQLALTVFQDILENGCNIATADINTTDISNENAAWMESYKVTRLIAKPTACDELLNSLGENRAFHMWADPFTGKVRCRAIRPNTDSITTYTDDENILADSMKAVDSPKDRASTAIVYYGQINPFDGESKAGNFGGWAIWQDAETASLYDEERIHKVYALWLGPNQHLDATSLANNWILRSKNTPTVLTFSLDAKDGVSLELTDACRVSTGAMQSPTGEHDTRAMQVLQRQEMTRRRGAAEYIFTAMDYQFDARYLILMEEGVDTENYSSATDEEKAGGGYLCNDSNVMPSDGSEGYRLS
jgi:hypothetical protein